MIHISTSKLINVRIILNNPIIKCDKVFTFKIAKIRNETDFSTVHLYDFTIIKTDIFPTPLRSGEVGHKWHWLKSAAWTPPLQHKVLFENDHRQYKS